MLNHPTIFWFIILTLPKEVQIVRFKKSVNFPYKRLTDLVDNLVFKWPRIFQIQKYMRLWPQFTVKQDTNAHRIIKTENNFISTCICNIGFDRLQSNLDYICLNNLVLVIHRFQFWTTAVATSAKILLN